MLSTNAKTDLKYCKDGVDAATSTKVIIVDALQYRDAGYSNLYKKLECLILFYQSHVTLQWKRL